MAAAKKQCFLRFLYLTESRGVTGIKVIFSDFFPGVKCFFRVEIPIFVDPKHISGVFKSEKQKKKKRSSPLFITVFHLFSIFTPFPCFPDTSANNSRSQVCGKHSASPLTRN